MNSQRGKASTKASRQNKSQKQRQGSKSQTNATRNPRPKRNRRSDASRNNNLQVSVSSAYSTTNNTGRAHVVRNGGNTCRIRHRELVASIVGSSVFTTSQSMSINPGLSASFPWLAIQAAGWEKYKFHKLRYCAYTRCASTTPGSLMLSVDYDAADNLPDNEFIASSYAGTVEDAPWKDICIDLDTQMLDGPKYIRLGGLSVLNGGGSDIKTYDGGTMNVFTIDGTAVNWAKLWVEYDVELINPQLPPAGAFASGTYSSGGGSLSQTNIFGLNPTTSGSFAISNTGVQVTLQGLQIGSEYAITMSSTGTGITVYTVSTFVGLTVKSQIFNTFNAADTAGCSFNTFIATASNVSFNTSVTASTITGTDLVICQLNPVPNF